MTTTINIESVAAQIHAYYFTKYGGAFPERYDNLPEYMKDDNRAAARRISTVLAIAGLRLALRKGPDWSPEDRKSVEEVIVENLEAMAEAEHDGWVNERVRQGWRPTSAP